jgi:putative endonuclease
LEDGGFVILGRNVRTGRLEVDIVARDGPVVIVIEVRTRGEGAWVRPLDSVDWKKQRYLRRAGERLWRCRYKFDTTLERMRFDIIAVAFDGDTARCEHVKAAF